MQPGSLISEDALPAWLRNDANPAASGVSAGPGAWGQPQGAQQGAGLGGAYGAGQPAPAPQYAPQYAAQYAAGPPPGGAAAGLIDESALPEWLRQGANGQAMSGQGMGGQSMPLGFGQPAHPPAYPAAAPGGPRSAAYSGPAGNMAAGSLIDERALPNWMNQPNSAGRPAPPASGSIGRREGMDARSLVDDSSLPQWLRGAQQGAPGQDGQWNAGAVPQEPLPAWLVQSQPGIAQPPGAQMGQSNSRPLPPSDDSALPEWLRGQSAPGAPAGAAPLDPAAMPAWVRSGSAAAEARFTASSPGASGAWTPGAAAPQVARQPANSAWLTDAHVPAANSPGASGVREAELPPWLRSAQQAAGQQSNGRTGGPPGEELPPWLRQGAPSPRAVGSSGRGRIPPDQRAGDPNDFGASRVRGNAARGQSDYSTGYGNGYGNGRGGDANWDEEDPSDDYEEEWEGERRHRERRHGLFGFLRRR